MLSRVLRGQQTSRAQFKVPSRANLVPQRKQVSLARLNPVPPALVVPHRGNRARNLRLSQAQPVQAALHKDRQPRPPQHHKLLPPDSKLRPSRQLRQRQPQQLQPRCLPPTYCCKRPWPQPSLVSLVQS